MELILSPLALDSLRAVDWCHIIIFEEKMAKWLTEYDVITISYDADEFSSAELNIHIDLRAM